MNKENNTALIVIVAVLLFVVMSSFGMMGFGRYGGYGMMGGYYGGFGGMWLFGWLFMGLVFIALILAILWLVRQISLSEEKTKRP